MQVRQVDLHLDAFTEPTHQVVVVGKTTSDASKCVPFPPDPNGQDSTINTVVCYRSTDVNPFQMLMSHER